jgi:hypothetical protein
VFGCLPMFLSDRVRKRHCMPPRWRGCLAGCTCPPTTAPCPTLAPLTSSPCTEAPGVRACVRRASRAPHPLLCAWDHPVCPRACRMGRFFRTAVSQLPFAHLQTSRHPFVPSLTPLTSLAATSCCPSTGCARPPRTATPGVRARSLPSTQRGWCSRRCWLAEPRQQQRQEWGQEQGQVVREPLSPVIPGQHPVLQVGLRSWIAHSQVLACVQLRPLAAPFVCGVPGADGAPDTSRRPKLPTRAMAV